MVIGTVAHALTRLAVAQVDFGALGRKVGPRVKLGEADSVDAPTLVPKLKIPDGSLAAYIAGYDALISGLP